MISSIHDLIRELRSIKGELFTAASNLTSQVEDYRSLMDAIDDTIAFLIERHSSASNTPDE